MKQIILAFVFLFISGLTWAQAPVDCIPDDYEDIDEDEDVQASDPCALDGANYVYSMGLGSLDEEEIEDYKEIASFVIWWATATPDYSFTLTDDLIKVTNKNKILLIIYFACLTKASLDGADDPDEAAIKLFARYISNPKNRVEQKGKVKKFMKDYNAGNYGKYIGQ